MPSRHPDWSALAWVFDEHAACPCCGGPGPSVLSLAYSGPDAFPGPHGPKPDSALPMRQGDILTEDFCVMDRYRFGRCMIELPLQGRPEHLYIGVWGTLSQADFDAYVARFDSRLTNELPEMNSWLSNAVPPGTPLPIACTLQSRTNGLQPFLLAQDDGPLKSWQDNGVAPDDLALILVACGHALV